MTNAEKLRCLIMVVMFAFAWVCAYSIPSKTASMTMVSICAFIDGCFTITLIETVQLRKQNRQ